MLLSDIIHLLFHHISTHAILLRNMAFGINMELSLRSFHWFKLANPSLNYNRKIQNTSNTSIYS